MKQVSSRRGWLFAFLVLVLGFPAVTLRALCVGVDCDAAEASGERQPFCDLPGTVRAGLTAGYYDDRSADVIAVAASNSHVRAAGALWPALSDVQTAVPIVLSGKGFREDVEIPGTPSLDQIAPTIAASMGLERPHPDVRSGRPMSEAIGEGVPSLTVLMVAEGISAAEARRMTSVQGLAAQGAASFDGRIGSLPVEPAAALTTIGTGASPAQHGITGVLVRDAQGELVEAWGPRSPSNVVATLGDHMDELSSQRAEIGLIGSVPRDRGLIGGRWYPDGDRDVTLFLPAEASRIARSAASALRDHRWGSDRIPDLLAVVLRGHAGEVDDAIERIVAAARAEIGNVSFVFTAIGSEPRVRSIRARDLIRNRLDDSRLIEAASGAGLYLNQEAMADLQASDNDVVSQMHGWRTSEGPLLLDVFPARAVVLGRYC